MSNPAEDSDDDPPARKGRGNAILTYETVAAIDKKLTEVSVKVDNLNSAIDKREEAHNDHEIRIRALELSHAGFVAASTRASGIWAWAVPVLLSIVTTLISVLTFARLAGK